MKGSFSEVRELCLQPIEDCLNGFLDRTVTRGVALNGEMSRYQLSTGGKRLRALIPCRVYQACGQVFVIGAGDRVRRPACKPRYPGVSPGWQGPRRRAVIPSETAFVPAPSNVIRLSAR